jgi:hypothetical protein
MTTILLQLLYAFALGGARGAASMVGKETVDKVGDKLLTMRMFKKLNKEKDEAKDGPG